MLRPFTFLSCHEITCVSVQAARTYHKVIQTAFSILSLSSQSIVHAPVSDDPQGSLLQAPLASCYASERALLLAFALRWRRETNTLAAEQMREVEKEIWLSHIHATVEEMENSVC